MITFTCNRESLMILMEAINMRLRPVPDRRNYFELRKNDRLVGHWNEISGDGEIMAHRLLVEKT